MFRRFLRDARAVSPVIASLILVTTVVVASAGVYLYSANFTGDGATAPKNLALTSASPIDGSVKTYTVPSATPQMRWSDIIVKLDGVVLNQGLTPGCGAPSSGLWIACTGPTTAQASSTITAGDTFKVHAAQGQRLHLLDVATNSVVLTLVIQ